MKTLIVVMVLFNNGDVQVSSQAFPEVCPTAKELQLGAEAIADGLPDVNRVSLHCTLIDGKVKLLNSPADKGTPS